MDKQTYYEATKKMESLGVDPDYIIGWQTGFLHSPKLEDQRVTPPYEAGYNDGLEGKTDGHGSWARQ
ncbi:MAG: Alvin_2107 family globule sulfur oxidation protein [Pseudomonadota bacterium]